MGPGGISHVSLNGYPCAHSYMYMRVLRSGEDDGANARGKVQPLCRPSPITCCGGPASDFGTRGWTKVTTRESQLSPHSAAVARYEVAGPSRR